MKNGCVGNTKSSARASQGRRRAKVGSMTRGGLAGADGGRAIEFFFFWLWEP